MTSKIKIERKPRVGIGVLVMKGKKTLLGRRLTSHGRGQFGSPGGYLEYMESFENCAKREVMEECGIEIKNVRFELVANVVHYAPKHHVHIGLIADWKSGKVKNLEPVKCESWDWYSLDKLPEPLFFQTRMALQNYKKGKIYEDF